MKNKRLGIQHTVSQRSFKQGHWHDGQPGGKRVEEISQAARNDQIETLEIVKPKQYTRTAAGVIKGHVCENGGTSPVRKCEKKARMRYSKVSMQWCIREPQTMSLKAMCLKKVQVRERFSRGKARLLKGSCACNYNDLHVHVLLLFSTSNEHNRNESLHVVRGANGPN
jgi:hypothetical protein